MTSSYTATKQPAPGRPFVRGDARINRKGRPKTFDALRALAQQIAHETAKDADGADIIVDGHVATITENILRQWATSTDPRLQLAFMEWAYGKPPASVAHTGSGTIPVRFVDYRNGLEGDGAVVVEWRDGSTVSDF